MSEALATALAKGDRDAVAAALDGGASVESLVDGRPLLAAACAARQPEIAALALERGADPNGAGEDGWTPLLLILAALDLNRRARVVSVRRRLHGVELEVTDPDAVGKLLGGHPLQPLLGLQDLAGTLIEKADLSRATPAGSSPLIQAAARGVLPLVEAMLGKDGVDIAAANGDGLTALHFAVRHNREDVVRALIQAGAPLDATDKWGATPLHEAAEQGRVAIARRLLVAGANAALGLTDAVGPHAAGATAAQVASTQGFADLAALLEGWPGESKDAVEAVVGLFDAVWVGRTKGVTQALERKPDLTERDARGRTALELAMDLGKKKSVGVLAEAAPAAAQPSLVAAAGVENTGMVKVLLDAGVSANSTDSSGDTALHRAAEGAARVIKPLLDKGADVELTDRQGRTPLLRAAAAGDSGSVKKLLRAGADANACDGEGRTALHLAALAARKHRIVHWRKEGRIGKDRVVYEIIDGDFTYTNNGALQPIQDKDIQTVAKRLVPHHLTWLGYVEVVKDLLKGGARATLTDAHGRTAAHLWSAENAVAAIVLLQKAAGRADLVRAIDKKGQLPIHAAAAAGAQASVLYFVNEVDRGLVGATDKAGNTPLHLAASAGDAVMVELLLALGAGRAAENADGRTPVAVAQAAGHEALARALRQG